MALRGQVVEAIETLRKEGVEHFTLGSFFARFGASLPVSGKTPKNTVSNALSTIAKTECAPIALLPAGGYKVHGAEAPAVCPLTAGKKTPSASPKRRSTSAKRKSVGKKRVSAAKKAVAAKKMTPKRAKKTPSKKRVSAAKCDVPSAAAAAAAAATTTARGERKRKRTPRSNSFKTYIYRVLKQMHATLGSTKKSMQILDDMTRGLMEQIVASAANLALNEKRATIMDRDVKTATRLILHGELSKHAASEATKAVTKFNASA